LNTNKINFKFLNNLELTKPAQKQFPVTYPPEKPKHCKLGIKAELEEYRKLYNNIDGLRDRLKELEKELKDVQKAKFDKRLALFKAARETS